MANVYYRYKIYTNFNISLPIHPIRYTLFNLYLNRTKKIIVDLQTTNIHTTHIITQAHLNFSYGFMHVTKTLIVTRAIGI